MKNLTAYILLFCLNVSASGQGSYWQQEVHYRIDVSLNDHEHTLDGFEKLEYTNHSPDTLRFIWFHLWPNAYKNDRTAFSDQLLENGNTRFYFSPESDRGYINRLDFKVDNVTAATEDHPQHIDIIKLVLPVPLPPGGHTTITTPFHVKLPYNVSRGGHDGQSYQATQWYPKPAVYDARGWHPLPYLDQGEFYSEFGSFDVRITLPSNYVVAATGRLMDETEKQWLEGRSNFTWQPITRKIKTKGGVIKTVKESFPPSSPENKTVHYFQDSVHDFAWFADKRFVVAHDSCLLDNNRKVDVYAYFLPESKLLWSKAVQLAKTSLRFYSSAVGQYPYPTLHIVEGPKSFGGGMEYPTITAISPETSEQELDLTIAHEIGHNWFYGMLASNEREHPWMDEGINSYYEQRYAALFYGRRSRPFMLPIRRLCLARLDQPIETTAENFSERNYYLVGYQKTADWMRYLESLTGSDSLDRLMQSYFNEWRFKHPQPDDLKRLMAEKTNGKSDSAFAWLSRRGLLPNEEPANGTDFFPAITGDVIAFDPARKANQLVFSPYGVGVNAYDKLMWGPVFAGNFAGKIPHSHSLQFLLVPQYSFGSKKLAGTGFINETIYSSGIFRKIDAGLLASVFSTDRFDNEDGTSIFLRAAKLAPGIRLTLNEINPRSQRVRYLQLRGFFVREDELEFRRDTVISGVDTSIVNRFSANSGSRSLLQAKLVTQNWRALYPYSTEWQMEVGKEFVRATFTGTKFFNFARGGGLQARLFAGKFFYLGSRTISKQFETDRYHLNMTGPNGYEDYTYSDYFTGRSAFTGWKSQQIMERDGGFKVRTDLLADKVGKTDDWLIALNISTRIPPELDPLGFLPFANPFHLFIDVGTYAAPWERNSNLDRFIFDAGIHIPLLKNTVNIYLPIMYSRVFKEYIQSTVPKKGRIFRLISFSIDLTHFNFRKFDRNFID